MAISRRVLWILLGVVGAVYTFGGSSLKTGLYVIVAEAASAPILTVKTRDSSYTLERGASSLPRHTIKTHTQWTEGEQEFSGILLSDILKAAGIDEEKARSSKLMARALNDYEVEIPADDIYRYNVIVADKMNGQDMPISKYGPFWIIYPRDEYTEIQDARFDHRWVWQLTELRVE